MKKLFLLLLGFLAISWSYGQPTGSQLVSSSGAHFEGSRAQLSWTIGEIVVESFTTGDVHLTHGFHQTNLFVTSIDNLMEDINVKIYPNPTADILHVEWTENPQKMNLRLLDANGRELWSTPNEQNAPSIKLDLSKYAAGNYYLHVFQPRSQQTQTFKILKHQ